MATHSSILSWENPMDRSLVGYRLQCRRRVRRDSTATTTIFHCVYVSYLLSPFISWWTYRLLPCLGYCEKCCNVHWGTCTFFNLNKVFPRYMTKGLLLCILSHGPSGLPRLMGKRNYPVLEWELCFWLDLSWSLSCPSFTSCGVTKLPLLPPRVHWNIEWESARSIIHKMPSS